MYSGKTTNQGISITWFELMEARTVNYSSDYFTNIERRTIVCWDYSHQVLSVVSGCFYRLNVQPLLWLNIEILYNITNHTKGFFLVLSKMVSYTRLSSVYISASQIFGADFLSCRRLHQRWSSEENCPITFDDNRFI